MKLLIASDLHGSLYWTEKLVKAFKDSQAEKLILLGDILYHGPRNDLPKDYNPKEVVKLLNTFASSIICVKGNCDAEVDEMVLDFDLSKAEKILTFPPLKDYTIHLVHGHHLQERTFPPNSIILFGHTHIPTIYTSQENYFINPGSVSIPKNSSPNSYVILEDRSFKIMDFEKKIIDRIAL
ncbi:MAG: phosphodiesterase [Sphaerochaetaceae bacterium]|nr:phosphodiesterase [Sphaerochaetaceae bacterium]